MRITFSGLKYLPFPQEASKRLCRCAVTLAVAGCFSLPAAAQSSVISTARERMHQSAQWQAIESHLPNPKTATWQTLELQADILRARRFPEDALEYYNYAIARGGDTAALLNKIGLTELEMRNGVLARAYFQRAVKINKKYAEAWNNLGAIEYMDGRTAEAVGDYKHAVKLDKKDAVFHSNLGTAYFEEKNYATARREIAIALKIDPGIFEHESSGSGVAAHILSAQDRARFAFEMAKLYAQTGAEEQMLHSLAMASEAGMDVQREMHKDASLAPFETDPRVVMLVQNAQVLRSKQDANASAASLRRPIPALSEMKAIGE